MSDVRTLPDPTASTPPALPLRSVLPAFVLDVALAVTLSFSTLMLGLFGWPVLGLILSSLVFALVHELPGLNGKPADSTLFLILVYTGMGGIFAWVYRRTGTLWAPIAAHILNNAIALAVLQVYGSAPV